MEVNRAITGLEQFKKDFKPFVGNSADWERVDAALAALKEREPIVQCKNCKFRHDPIRCRLDSEGLKTPDDWFCADGERKEHDASTD